MQSAEQPPKECTGWLWVRGMLDSRQAGAKKGQIELVRAKGGVLKIKCEHLGPRTATLIRKHAFCAMKSYESRASLV